MITFTLGILSIFCCPYFYLSKALNTGVCKCNNLYISTTLTLLLCVFFSFATDPVIGCALCWRTIPATLEGIQGHFWSQDDLLLQEGPVRSTWLSSLVSAFCSLIFIHLCSLSFCLMCTHVEALYTHILTSPLFISLSFTCTHTVVIVY